MGLLAEEIFGINSVDGCKIVHALDEYGCFYNVLHGSTCCFQKVLHILHYLLCLAFDPFGNLASGRVYRNLEANTKPLASMAWE